MSSSPFHNHSSSTNLLSFLRISLPRSLRRYFVLVLLILINIAVLFWLYGRRSNGHHDGSEDDDLENVERTGTSSHVKSMPSPPDVTVVFREFEDFDNAVASAVASVLHILPGVPIVIVADKLPYPPIVTPDNAHSVRIVALEKPPGAHYTADHLEKFISTPFVLFMPDGAMMTRRDHVQNLLVGALKRRRSSSINAVAIGLTSHSAESLSCVNMSFSSRRWTLTKVGGGGIPLSTHHSHDCIGSAVREDDGPVAIFVRTESLWNLSHPFARPFPHSFYVQASLHGFVVRLETRFRFGVSRSLFLDAHNRWKHKMLEKDRKKELYKTLGIKKVVHQQRPSDQSSSAAVEWFGCTRESSRCFPSVPEGENPAYINEGRWTPPCCLEKLRETTRHVAKVLEAAQVRYWLEGGSLLGAVRQADIIPWDYDVDFGMFRSDYKLCRQLRQAWEEGAYEDEDGFVWERAREADFFRVQYSRSNRLHVDIFPFYLDEKRLVMTKDFWFETHRQDVEFPESYLRPMAVIPFVGTEVAAPNNAKAFLELKFGKGVVENPRYPKGASPLLASSDESDVAKGVERPLLHGD